MLKSDAGICFIEYDKKSPHQIFSAEMPVSTKSLPKYADRMVMYSNKKQNVFKSV